MGFLNNIFGPKNKTEKKEKTIPEYHKCPMCGEMVKTNILIEDDNKCYLDGESKRTLKDTIDSMQFCEKCGYIYDGYNYEFYGDNAPVFDGEQRKIVTSKEYQDIFHDTALEEYYKKMLLMKLVYPAIKLTKNGDIHFEYKYYFENKNIEKERELLELKLQRAIQNKETGRTIMGGQLCYNNKYKVRIWHNEIIIDILRRQEKFDEAKQKLLEHMEKFKQENPNNESQQEYFNYQLKLIEACDNRHI